MKWLLVLGGVVGLFALLGFGAESVVPAGTVDKAIVWLRTATDGLASPVPPKFRDKAAQQKAKPAKASPRKKVLRQNPGAAELAQPGLPSQVPVVAASAQQAQRVPHAIRDDRKEGAPMEKLDQADRDRLSAIIDAKITQGAAQTAN